MAMTEQLRSAPFAGADFIAALKEGGVAAFIALVLAITVIGMRTVDQQGGLGIEFRPTAVAVAVGLVFVGRILLVLWWRRSKPLDRTTRDKVMDRIGARELVTQARMSAVLKARRSDKRTAALMRLIGLEMKLRQYEMGERFIKGVEDGAAWSTLDLAWESPEALPTLEEIEFPDLWLQRIA